MMLKSVLAAAFIAVPTLAYAVDLKPEWAVDPDSSAVFYVSTKNGHVAERHAIRDVSGGLLPGGALTVTLGMDNVDSGVDARDARLRTVLYKVVDFPKATFSAEIDMDEYADLAVGESAEGFLDGELSLVGTTSFVSFDVLVTRAGEDRVVVSSFGPTVIDATEVALDAGVDELRTIAKLDSISYAVPVTFTVALTRP